MIFLVLAILTCAMFSVVFKICQMKNINGNQVITLNYIFGAVFFIISILTTHDSIPISEAINIGWFGIGFAVIEALFFFGGFTIMDISTWRSGVALTTAAAKVALILPVLLSWIFLGQSMPSWLSFALIMAAMLLIILPNKPQYHDPSLHRSKSDAIRKRKAALCLLGVFFCFGTSDFMMKIAQNGLTSACNGNTELQDLRLASFTTCIFLIATCLSSIISGFNGTFIERRITWKTILMGLLLGLVNIGCTFSVLKSLTYFSTAVFYPSYNIGVVVVGAIIGLIFFHEKLKPLQILGIILALVAILIQ